MPIPELVLLLDDEETMRALKISAGDLAWLVATEQLAPIFLRGRRRFLLSDVDQLIKNYQKTQLRS